MVNNEVLEEWEIPQINDAKLMLSLHYKCGLDSIQVIEVKQLTTESTQLRVMVRGKAGTELIELPDIYFGDTSGVHTLH